MRLDAEVTECTVHCVALQTMQAAKATPGILKICGSQKLLDQLTECNKLLESVQKVHADASVGTMAAHVFCLTWHNPLVFIITAHVFSLTWHNLLVLFMQFIKLAGRFRRRIQCSAKLPK